MLAEPMRNLLMGQPELFDQASQAACLLDRIEVGALQVFDEAKHQLLVVAGVTAHDRGHLVEPGQARGTPAAFAGDELEPIRELAHEQRLQHPVQPDRLGELAERLGVEA